jgi:ABC-2 type transport system ATP-binding protein
MNDVKPAALEAARLSVFRGGRPVLSELSFSVAPGEVYGLLGGNGVGKSTTLLTFLGFLKPASGQARVQGRPVSEDVAGARRAMAYLPESAALYEHLSAYENLAYFLELAALERDGAAMEAALDRVALRPDAREQALGGYSKGMRQKVAIALALLRDAPLLLLDEPTSGLDPTAIDEFHDLVRALADAGKAVLMVTHDVYGACQVADRIGLLKGGALVGEFAAGPAGSISTEQVHRAFTAGGAA